MKSQSINLSQLFHTGKPGTSLLNYPPELKFNLCHLLLGVTGQQNLRRSRFILKNNILLFESLRYSIAVVYHNTLKSHFAVGYVNTTLHSKVNELALAITFFPVNFAEIFRTGGDDSKKA